MKLSPFLLQLKKYFKENGVIDFAISAEEIVSFVLKIPRQQLFLHSDAKIKERDIKRIEILKNKRAKNHIPLSYLLGTIDFYGCKISLSSEVLICRPETELLVDLIVKRLKKESLQAKRLLDLCTGSGCIAIALKKTFPELEVAGSDSSKRALLLAKKNAEKNGVSIDWRLGDLLEPFSKEKLDYIVCNPPYVSESEYESLSEEVKKEPKKALIGGKSGLEFYERLSLELPKVLHSKAKIFFEIGYTQRKGLQKFFNTPFWKRQEFIKDYSGKDRFFFVEIE